MKYRHINTHKHINSRISCSCFKFSFPYNRFASDFFFVWFCFDMKLKITAQRQTTILFLELIILKRLLVYIHQNPHRCMHCNRERAAFFFLLFQQISDKFSCQALKIIC